MISTASRTRSGNIGDARAAPCNPFGDHHSILSAQLGEHSGFAIGASSRPFSPLAIGHNPVGVGASACFLLFRESTRGMAEPHVARRGVSERQIATIFVSLIIDFLPLPIIVLSPNALRATGLPRERRGEKLSSRVLHQDISDKGSARVGGKNSVTYHWLAVKPRSLPQPLLRTYAG